MLGFSAASRLYSLAATAVLFAVGCAKEGPRSLADAGVPKRRDADAREAAPSMDARKPSMDARTPSMDARTPSMDAHVAAPPCPMPPDPAVCDGLLASSFGDRNPARAWTYGWAAALGRPFTAFTRFDPGTDAGPGGLGCWYSMELADGSGAHVPAVCAGAGSLDGGAHPREVLLLPGAQGQYAIVEWTAPAAGAYHVYAQFTGFSGAAASTPTEDVHLQGDGRDILSSVLDPSGGRNTFCASINLNLVAGATLEFSVGRGGGATAPNATGLRAFVCPR
jgi:hypothetical protein